MKSIVKLFGVTSCCLLGTVAAANAEPTMLADAELDRVTAGACVAGPSARYCNDTPGSFPRSLPPPGSFNPVFPMLDPIAALEPIFFPSIDIESISPALGPFVGCSPAFDCGVPMIVPGPSGG